MGYVCGHRQQPSDRQHMGTAFNPAKTSPASWDAFSDVDAFVDAVLAELAAMAADGTRRTRSGPKPPLTGAALRKAIMAIWCVTFCGMQWRAIGQLCDIPFGTLYTLFARWTRLGLWRRLLNRLIQAWRRACGDTADPSAVILDSRSCHSAPGQSGEAQAFPIQESSLTAEVPRRRSIPQSTLRLKYSSTNEHNPHRYGSPKKGFYRLRPIALAVPYSTARSCRRLFPLTRRCAVPGYRQLHCRNPAPWPRSPGRSPSPAVPP